MFPTVTVLVTFSKIYAESMKTDREFSNLDTYRELDSLLTHGAEALPFLGVLVSPKMHLEKFRYTGAVRIHLFGVWLAYEVHVNLIFTEERIQRTAFPDALTRQSTKHLQYFTLILREDRPRILRTILAFARSFLPAAGYALVGEFMVAFFLVFIASRTAVNSDVFIRRWHALQFVILSRSMRC